MRKTLWAVLAAVAVVGFPSSSYAKVIRLKVDGDRQTGFKMAELLNKHGRDKGLDFVIAEDKYDFRVAIYTEGMSTSDMLFGGGADSSAAVLSPKCELLFVVTRGGRMTEGGALNAVSKELAKKFKSYLAVTSSD